ncbi:hypothetical protein GY45DRAFT_174889 [Cubamyces sp. BRFM 1775]|nr:hypothetical protein GY45DRAFT_174889 [Cubamyces sp. BRFM 1775]
MMPPPSLAPTTPTPGTGAYLRPRVVPSQSSQPVAFSSGYLAGRTIRVHLEEIQKADVGRKFARKDKRPLDPPPVVLCRFYEVFDRGSGLVEVEMDPTMLMDAICHVELFPVPDGNEPEDTPTTHDDTPILPPILTPGFASTSAAPMRPHYPAGTSQAQYGMDSPMLDLAGNMQTFSVSEQLPPLYAALQSGFSPLQSSMPSSSGLRRQGAMHIQDERTEDDIVAWFGSYPIHESSNCTRALAGATFTTAVIIDYENKQTAVFVFSDLAVQIEGTFILRYRIFNVHSDCAAPPYKPVLAACYGGSFKIYSTKEFPGLLASTSLTKKLAFHGVRVNLRETPRKRRKRNELRSKGEGGSGDEDAGFDSPSSDTAMSTSPTTSIHPRLRSPSASSPSFSRRGNAPTFRSPTELFGEEPPQAGSSRSGTFSSAHYQSSAGHHGTYHHRH